MFLQSKSQFQHDAITFYKHTVKSADILEELKKTRKKTTSIKRQEDRKQPKRTRVKL